MTGTTLASLRKEIIQCRMCPRLVEFREKVSNEKRRQYSAEEYWGRPVPGFGDANARLVVVGLAPAAHGGNRTGRVFTGDGSARFLIKHLHRAGFSNKGTSEFKHDGLEYNDTYVTAVVRCVPPGDKPTTQEKRNCFPYFQREMLLLKNASIILALGRVAFESIVHLAREKFGTDGKFEFKHGGKYYLSSGFPSLYASYHPSPRNTNTGKLTNEMFERLLNGIKDDLTLRK